MQKKLKGNKKSLYLIGIDEAGRGSLAGPVVVAGIGISIEYKVPGAKRRREAHKMELILKALRLKLFKNIKDSKKLTPAQREEWYKFITSHPRIKWTIAKTGPKVIDRINVAEAANLAAARVYRKLAGASLCPALLDGGLYLAKKIPSVTIIKGDETVPIISAASIIAKVARDRFMLRLHKRYPNYRFDLHKGYGTGAHREAIKKFGISAAHRRTFVKKRGLW